MSKLKFPYRSTARSRRAQVQRPMPAAEGSPPKRQLHQPRRLPTKPPTKRRSTQHFPHGRQNPLGLSQIFFQTNCRCIKNREEKKFLAARPYMAAHCRNGCVEKNEGPRANGSGLGVLAV